MTLQEVILESSPPPHYVGNTAVITATVHDDAMLPVANERVFFGIDNGPHTGRRGDSLTNGAGQSAFSYFDNGTGIDEVRVSITSTEPNPLLDTMIPLTWSPAPWYWPIWSLIRRILHIGP